VCTSGVIDTAGAEDLEFERLWLTLKGISIKKSYIGKFYYPLAITITQKYRGYLKIVFGTGAKIGNLQAEYLQEFEAICKKALTCESGALVGLFDEKNKRSKIS
jgi:hypothetical protein